MDYSSITIDFSSIPAADSLIDISESVKGLNLNEVFKALRSTAGEVTLPSSALSEWQINVPFEADDRYIGVSYVSIYGTISRVRLTDLLQSDYSIGFNTYYVDSEFEPTFFDRRTDVAIVWDYSFEPVGASPDYYSDFVSDTYKTAFDADHNASEFYTVVSVPGPSNSGIGVVTITANYYNAVFTIAGNTSLATITVNNVAYVERDNYATPELLLFNLFGNYQAVPTQNITIKTAGAWSVTSSLPSWLQLSALSGTGNATLIATAIYSNVLPEGISSVVVDVNVAGQISNITVAIKVIRFITIPFAADKLYFTQELEYLSFSSITPDTFVQLQLAIKVFKINTNAPKVYNRTYNFPLFQGKGNFHVGTIVHGLLEEIEKLSDFVPSFDSNFTKNQLRPAEISISFQEKAFGATVPGLVSGVIPIFTMTKGYKPFMTDGQLALLTVAQQDIIRITPQSYIGTSFVFFGTPRIIVKKNNAIIEDFEITPEPNEVIYSYFRFINNLKPGDSIDLIIVNGLETRTQRFLVFMNGLESTYFLFENNNGVVEPFEFSGRRRVFAPLKHITTTKFKDLYSYNEKVKTDITQTFAINTGQLGKTEHRVLTALASSTKVWCSLDDPKGPYFRLDATTSKIMNQDTSANEEGLEIEFNLLENANASIYPR